MDIAKSLAEQIQLSEKQTSCGYVCLKYVPGTGDSWYWKVAHVTDYRSDALCWWEKQSIARVYYVHYGVACLTFAK